MPVLERPAAAGPAGPGPGRFDEFDVDLLELEQRLAEQDGKRHEPHQLLDKKIE